MKELSICVIKKTGYFIFIEVQGEQLNMAVFFMVGTLEKVTSPVYTCTVAYTGKVTFYKVPEKTVIFNWSPCRWLLLLE